MENVLIDTLDKLSDAHAPENIRESTAHLLERVGFKQFTYLDTHPGPLSKVGFFISTYPSQWTKRYIDEAYRGDDPVLSMAASTTDPFCWSATRLPSKMSARQATVMHEAWDYNVGSGITIPLHGPGTQLRLFTATLENDQSDAARLLVEYRYNLLLLASTINSAVEKLNCIDVPSVCLSNRQEECLLWTARGKTAWEIGKITSISERTVNFHLRAVMKKFDVNNKHHAVVKAIMYGVIQP